MWIKARSTTGSCGNQNHQKIQLYLFFGLMVLDLTGGRAFILGAKLLPLCDAFLIWAPFKRTEPAPDRLVWAIFLPVMPALVRLLALILVPFCGSNFWKQVLGLATIRPFLGPELQRKPFLIVPFLARLRIWLTPSAMAEWSGCSSTCPLIITGTMSCGTTSCVLSSLMALNVVALDLVSSCLFGTRMISVIFITVFIDLTPTQLT